MRAFTRRATGVAIAVGSITAAISLAGMGAAQADDSYHGGKGGGTACGKVGIEHSVDGGQTWTTNGRMDGDTQPATVQVRLSAEPKKKCSYTISLASYSAEGPTWDTSGNQQFLGWDTVTLNSGKTEATLSVSDTAPQCYGQIDLYGNGTKYDGSSPEAALPNHDKNILTPTDLITAWNGGHKCDETTPPTDSPSPSTSPATDSPSPSTSPATDSPSPSTSPTTSAPAVGDTSSPSPSASATGSTTAPTGTPSVPPASTTGNLAETGGNGSQTVAFAAGGAALLVAGGAAVYFTRRRKSSGHAH